MAKRISLVEFSSRRRKTRRFLFWSGILIACILLVIGAGWVAARSPVFAAREVRIEGLKYIPESDVRDFLDRHVAKGRVSGFFGAGNLLAWPEGFGEAELRELPAAATVKIRKHYFRRSLTVVVEERARAGQWCFAPQGFKECYWFDDRGVLFMRGYPAEGNLIPVVHDYSRPPLALGETALPQRFMGNLLSIFKALQSTDLSVREVRIENLALEEVAVETYEGPRLLFSLRFSAAPAPDAIAALARMTPLANLEYVDFRVENKVYYR